MLRGELYSLQGFSAKELDVSWASAFCITQALVPQTFIFIYLQMEFCIITVEIAPIPSLRTGIFMDTITRTEFQVSGSCRKGVIGADLVWILEGKTRCWVGWESHSDGALAWLSEVLTAQGD